MTDSTTLIVLIPTWPSPTQSEVIPQFSRVPNGNRWLVPPLGAGCRWGWASKLESWDLSMGSTWHVRIIATMNTRPRASADILVSSRKGKPVWLAGQQAVPSHLVGLSPRQERERNAARSSLKWTSVIIRTSSTSDHLLLPSLVPQVHNSDWPSTPGLDTSLPVRLLTD